MLQNVGDGLATTQATFMHRVCIIVHCVSITISLTITGTVFYCNYCFRRINHLVVKTICIHPLVYKKLCRAHVGLDVFCLTEARALAFDTLYTFIAVPMFHGEHLCIRFFRSRLWIDIKQQA
jgi:hypothetical protein